MFAKKQPDLLRKKLSSLQRELKLKNVTQEGFNQQVRSARDLYIFSR